VRTDRAATLFDPFAVIPTVRSLVGALALASVVVPGAGAQQPVRRDTVFALSLTDALSLAVRASETVRTAEAGVRRAGGQYAQARSQLLPQVNGSASYQRAIQLQFEEITRVFGEDDGGGNGGGGDGDGEGDGGFGAIGRVFASPNTVVLGLSASQNLFTGGALGARVGQADAARRVAALQLTGARAQIVYDAAAAYFDALVADRLAAIADSSVAQAERALAQTEAGRQAGTVAEFDLLRARVARDNALPNRLRARRTRDVAYLRLRQLLDLPLGARVALTSPLEPRVATVAAIDVARDAALAVSAPDTAVERRNPVRQAGENVRAAELGLKATRAARLPSVQLTSLYQRFSYPEEGTILDDNWRFYFPNWTVSLGVAVPLFTGGRQRGDEDVARAAVAQAQAQFQQVREAAALETETIVAELAEAEATFAASASADVQAQRAYEIAEVRFREGLSTQLELGDARVQLEQARATRAQAARQLELARLKLLLLRDLPLGGTGAAP
jgi:outer membrane protein TolC